jgi:hypothetical protein
MFGVGIGIGIGRQRFAGGGFDADYQKILTLSSAAGYTLPSAGQQIKQNDLVLALKAGGIWSKLDTFALFANDVNISNPIPNPYSNAFALVDWIRTANTNTLVTYTAVNSPTWSSNGGFTGNGTSSYIDTNFNPATQGVNYTLNNASRYALITGTNTTIDGNSISSSNNQFRRGSSTNHTINATNVLNSSFSFAENSIISIHRTSANDVTLFNDKTSGTRTQLSVSLPIVNQFILRRATLYSDNMIKFYAMGASLVSENNAFVDALNTYFS